MDYMICGGKRLNGEIAVYGAKNCALALLGASVLTDDCIVLNNCPRIADMENMLRLLSAMGKHCVRSGDSVSVSGQLATNAAPRELAMLLRGSALILGSTLARYGEVTLPLPGGCAIGSRPMDIHLDGLRALGVHADDNGVQVRCFGRPIGASYYLRFASVGATENLLCACSLAEGESVLTGCATEPEVVALEQILVQMGAHIDGIGESTVRIDGVKSLHGTVFDVIPDRIVAATYLSAAVATCGSVTVTKCVPQHFAAFTDLLRPRFDVRVFADAVRVTADRQPNGYGNVITAPYPLFATDMQSPLMSLAACSRGKTVLVENLFENRLAHNAEELRKMGACISVDGNRAIIDGRTLVAADVTAHDLRGGAGLVIAALNANGHSRVRGVNHIDRGYCNLDRCLASLGADVVQVD